MPDSRFDDLTAWLWTTPNSRRITLLFEELGLAYRIRPVNIRAGDQYAPAIKALNPYCKIPIVAWSQAGERRIMFESGAILLHFAERCDGLLPKTGSARGAAYGWLMMAVSGLAPASGLAHHWLRLAPQSSDVALKHAQSQVLRAWSALEDRLAANRYLAGEYSIADIAAWPWIERAGWTGLELAEFPRLRGWYGRIAKREPVQRAMRVLEDLAGS